MSRATDASTPQPPAKIGVADTNHISVRADDTLRVVHMRRSLGAVTTVTSILMGIAPLTVRMSMALDTSASYVATNRGEVGR